LVDVLIILFSKKVSMSLDNVVLYYYDIWSVVFLKFCMKYFYDIWSGFPISSSVSLLYLTDTGYSNILYKNVWIRESNVKSLILSKYVWVVSFINFEQTSSFKYLLRMNKAKLLQYLKEKWNWRTRRVIKFWRTCSW
jgi:hypothetical protein